MSSAIRAVHAWVIAAILLTGLGPASAQVEVLTPDLVAKLDPAKVKSLTLTASGDAARFQSRDDEWEEAAPPLILDVNGDGIKDFAVLLLASEQTMIRALLIHDWGDAPDAFGPAVFYVILDSDGTVTEWAGQHRLRPRAAPRPPGAPPAEASPAPKN